MTVTVSAGHALVSMLASLGVTRFYGVPCESLSEILGAVERDPGLALVSSRHVVGASFMAEAHGRLTGVPAVAVATGASAAAALSAGVRTAYRDAIPMIVLVRRADRAARGGRLQETDLPALYRPTTKWAVSLHDPDHAAEVAHRAFLAATTGRPGPVLIELPAGVVGQATAGCGSSSPAVSPSGEAASGAAADIRARLAAARRPVAIAGGGAVDARTELVGLAEKFGVGVFTASGRQDAFPNDHPKYLGHLASGMPARVVKLLDAADLVLLLGARMSDVTPSGGGLPGRGAAVIAIADDPRDTATGPVADLEVTAGVAPALREVLSAAGADVVRDEVADYHRAYLEESEPGYRSTGAGVHPVSVVRAMMEALPGDSIIASDAGSHGVFPHRYWRYRYPRTQLAPADGTTGYAVPAAVAAKLNKPERTVVAVVEDGDFLRTGAEIETSVRLGVPIVVVVMRHGPPGTAMAHRADWSGRTGGAGIGDSDPVRYGRSLGAEGIRVKTHEELVVALDSAFCSLSTTVIDVPVAPDVTQSGRAEEAVRRGASGTASC